jgi:IS605 OrfB family transposase
MPEQLGIALTQRAYTLRLSGSIPGDNSWRDRLWKTHEAVNKGAKSFGEWLLTMRGGLGPSLAEIAGLASKPAGRLGAQAVKQRRILLALSWLSVESEKGAPWEYIVPHDFDAPSGTRSNWRTVEVLREILQGHGVSDEEVGLWVQDCSASLLAAIRSDAVWVNRRRAFHDALVKLGLQVSEEDIWDFLGRFFSSPKVYLLPIEATYKDENDSPTNSNTEEQGPKDLVQNAGQWLSSRFGTGKGAQFGSMAIVYERIAKWAESAPSGLHGSEALAGLADTLSEFGPPSQDLDGILKLVSGPGYKSATRNVLTKINNQGSCTADDLLSLRKKAESDAEKCKVNTGSKGPRAYANAILRDVEARCGFAYLQEEGPARHWQFAVMLDHAARRVSAAHTWVKRAEAERREFETDAEKIRTLPEDARQWLDQYCQERSRTSGALEPYRIRKRAVAGWKEVVTVWSKTNCQSEAHRIAAARTLQDDPEIDKFGDVQLFEALAAENALCVWRTDRNPDPSTLLNYAAATDAEAKKRRFKVPAYRHPDPSRHPIFCDFGNSRWEIKFNIHEMRKRDAKKSREKKGEHIDLQGMSMGLWDGASVSKQPLRWRSKRFTADLISPKAGGAGEIQCVSRADRLGRAALGVSENSSIHILQLFVEKEWNGRLQAPRAQLDDLANHLDKNGNQWDTKACRMRDRLGWLVSFSAKLQPQGPWVEYAKEKNLISKAEINLSPRNARDEWRGIAYPFWHPANEKGRKGLGKHLLSQLHGLRVLSVDLGHRYAAACAVWETVSEEDLRRACAAVGIAPPAEGDLYLFAKAISNGKTRTTVYRRIGANVLADGKTHPAPWARLDRQFLIKLQGEDIGARKASSTEIAEIEKLERDLGFKRSVLRTGSQLAVDELMHEAVRLLRLALKRHSDRARISFNLTTKNKLLSGGGEKALDPESRIELVTDMLVLWRALFSSDRWTDEWATKQWQDHIQPLLGDIVLPEVREEENETAQKRKKRDEDLRVGLKYVADKLAGNPSLCAKLNVFWAARWQDEDTQWRPRLRWIRDWLMPRGVGRNGKTRQSIRHVGGVSLSRISTFKSLYQLEKSFKMRPEPDDLRKNVPKPGDESTRKFGQRILDAMESMRENRVKQLASRIAEAALGIGKEEKGKDGRQRKRPQQRILAPQFAPCHAVIIENLTRYRPEETRTRRENQQLMSWSSSKVKKYLSEACQLNGLHLREVSAAYTSKQDSRTGAPGMRCKDVPVKDFLESPFWNMQITAADQKMRDGSKGDARERYLLALRTHWATMPDVEKAGRSIRIPYRGGEVFVSAQKTSPASGGLQADLNAAANIGLKALLDPDWSGRWWYIPCDAETYRPIKDKIVGCLAIKPTEPLIQVKGENAQSPDAHTPRRTRNTERRIGSQHESKDNIVNLWRDTSAEPVNNERATGSKWQPYSEYWNKVQFRVVNVLREKAGLPRDSSTS